VRDFGHLEGVYIPAAHEKDIPMVGINMSRPITRQRFTAAHELCHYFRDSEQQICPIGSKSALENSRIVLLQAYSCHLGSFVHRLRSEQRTDTQSVTLFYF